MSNDVMKAYMTDEQFESLKAIELDRSNGLFARVNEQTEILKAQEARKDEALRDMFATNALIGLGTWMPMPDSGLPSLVSDASLQDRADWAYRQADAMMAARER